MNSKIIVGQHNDAINEMVKIIAQLSDRGILFDAVNDPEDGWIIKVR